MAYGPRYNVIAPHLRILTVLSHAAQTRSTSLCHHHFFLRYPAFPLHTDLFLPSATGGIHSSYRTTARSLQLGSLSTIFTLYFLGKYLVAYHGPTMALPWP